MLFLALYYLLTLIVILAICAAVYRQLGRFGRVRYAAIPVFLIASILLIPIPIHGGFMVFAEVVVDGIEEFFAERQHVVREQQQTDWKKRFDDRLPVAVAIIAETRLNPRWSKVTLADQAEAWLDVQEGLVWRDAIVDGGGDSLANLTAACRGAGPFTLALEIELYYFYRNQGPQVMPFADLRYPSLLIDEQFQLDLIKWRKFGTPANDQGTDPATAVRCVGRTQQVPVEGLLNRQISAVEWNEFQMAPIR